MTFQLPTQEEKAEFVHEQFERIARGYDLSNDVISMGMHRSWKIRAVSEIIKGVGEGNYLDVCCGTGDLSLWIARLAEPGSSVVGLDFSQNMLDIADARSVRKARKVPTNTDLSFIRGDAQDLPFEDDSFDAAIISFGLRNLTDLQKGLDEMARVVRPGGRVANLDLGHCQVPLFAPVFKAYFGKVVPVVGGILQNDKEAYTYLPESLSTYPAPDKITAMFEEAGLEDVKHIPLALGTVALHVGTKR